MLSAARRHDVVLITRSNNVAAIEAFLTGLPEGRHIEIVGIDLSSWAQWFKKRTGRFGLYAYYDLWQRLAGSAAADVHRQNPVDLVHHVTLATYWQMAGVHRLDVPFVLGPVGGGVSTPSALIPELGRRGIIIDLVRLTIQRLWERRPSVRATWRAADLVLAQNRETAIRIRGNPRVRIVPNGVSAAISDWSGSDARSRDIVVVGRMLPYKAGVLAIRAFAKIGADARLVFIGDGPERSRLEAAVDSLGLGRSVEFAGRVPRSEVLKVMSTAAALLHPAVHDDSPLTVVEALSVGTPVVCLDHGGPPVLCHLFPQVDSKVVPVTSRRGTIKALAEAMDAVLAAPTAPAVGPVTPLESFGDLVLAAYDDVLNN